MHKFILVFLLPIGLAAQINNFSWPMAPMDQQHRISATFDECRENRDHFHNGTDMPLAPGENVLSIMAGAVTDIGSDWIRVEDFAYVHVIPLATLHVGNTVAQGAVVGHTDSYAHIHLNYGGGVSGHPTGNPLMPGKITPFVDPYHPRSPIIQFVQDATSNAFSGNTLSGRVDIIAQAADTTDLQSSIDMNNGIYTIGWALLSADTSQVLSGPHFWFEADELYSNSNIYRVYAHGSSTSIYRYIVTNRITSNDYLDCDLYEPGPYVISVMSSDTRDNWDTTYVNVQLSDIDLLPPGRPDFTYIGPDVDGNLYLEWVAPTDTDLGGYILEFSLDGSSWESNHGPETLTADLTTFIIESIPDESYIEFRMKAVDTAPVPNQSELSDTYGVRLNNSQPSILIVDGFDRTNGSWTIGHHNFATYYSQAIVNSSSLVGISTASNEWVTASQNLEDYYAVFWFLGDDSRTDETFSTSEQSVISAYLAEGGYFFTSGAEIGYDLSAGSTGDEGFLNQVLHVNYMGDDGNHPTINGVAPYFTGIGFNYGTSPYIEDWPDHFSPSFGGEIALKYGNGLNAAISFRDNISGTFVMGLAFETIDTETQRTDLIERVMQYFAGTVETIDFQLPEEMSISRVYPNPFNASINIEYQLDHYADSRLLIYDIQGKMIIDREVSNASPGTYIWTWNAKNNNGRSVPSGAYFIQLIQGEVYSATHKVVLLK
ncbi:MAG: T9SS type A sorting domain-containing protein [Candidatus Marinimicrobia bacterium]|nr:T9SS type A sorting domain-containing protein [Candidatus Neomarinimicrobiota bacterium]MBT3630063.1 T9SS type A sorting domain-containing protein [Candidatus Neomarinimicrobiota bacterium]MBT3824230.1 T9SS type A sorting domain-containing protein [Candidatus Neomarinimicrobiota bacterium]MBT4131682.1 T9SS type A sorting domain-containing protein [Candidatus Neomarinimicrobiota bacterium]MBT4295488.1 T9SS type A sorting domain-containing protein [Candidatus Neomarinimicrobiota bacterium]